MVVGQKKIKKDKAYKGQMKILKSSHTSKKSYVAKLSITLRCLEKH